MPNWTEKNLEQQFDRAKKNAWIAMFKKSAQEYGFAPEVLMGIASRETNMRNIIGDGGHGYGIMQIDDRSFPDWTHSGLWKDVSSGIQKGALVLDSKREVIRKGQGKTLKIGGTSFTGKDNLTPNELLRTSIAAYNAGLWAYYGLSKNGDPDVKTTGKDYSADTLERIKVFKALL